MRYLVFTAFTLLSASLLPLSAHAAGLYGKFEVSGWLPYWRAASSTTDVLPHLDELTEINPFVYSLKSDGTLLDNGKLEEEPWKSLIARAHGARVRVVPTVMTGNGALLHSLLSDTKNRIALEDRVANLVKEKGFDGIDIDFEGKRAEDKNHFSTFLKGLSMRMGQKWVMCSIEARTPPDARYYGAEVPPDATIYANDFKAINKYCDRVRIMAYDQQGVDQLLAAQAASSSEVYAPLADPRWVEKVVDLAARDISRRKIMIGVPTYGYEYDVTAYAGSQFLYKILWTFNPGYALPIAAQYGVTPSRNAAGEAYFTYVPAATSSKPQALGAGSAMLAAAAASTYADAYNSHLSFRLMDWSDAQSVAGKIALAESLGVRGISVFKFDGGEDPAIWGVLAGVARRDDSAVASRTPVFTRGLDVGDTGEDVRALQKILNSDPDTRVAESGAGAPGHESLYFGAATKSAVGRFQKKHGIAQPGDAGFGYVGPKTRATLDLLSPASS